MGLLQLIACRVEELGIELPSGGVSAVSHEDLRRDTRLLAGADPGAVWGERLGQMGMTATPAPPPLAESASCFARGDGVPPVGKARLLVAAWPGNPDEATAAAALISIAKAWDLAEGPEGRATLCLLARGAAFPDRLAAGLAVGPLAAGSLVWGEGSLRAEPADPTRTAERINYTDLQARTQAIVARL